MLYMHTIWCDVEVSIQKRRCFFLLVAILDLAGLLQVVTEVTKPPVIDTTGTAPLACISHEKY